MNRLLAAFAASALVLSACSSDEGSQGDSTPEDRPSTTAAAASPSASAGHEGHETADSGHTAKPAKSRPLRPGERRKTVRMPEPYTPSAPYGTGTDDYRCFLLDPQLKQDAWLTGTNVLPGNREVVHHVILFRISPENVAAAEARDAQDPGQGWTCFGGTGVDGEFADPEDASWLGAWAPGSGETVLAKGYGVPLDRGSRIVMQVHYNLLAGNSPDTSATQVRWTPRTTDLQALHTVLLPAPVELPCRPEHSTGPLCDREAAVEDAKARFGDVGQAANLLHLLCGTRPDPTETMVCTRKMRRPMTILGAAGHMHLLGKWIRIETNTGTPRARTVLDIRRWNFDDQGARPLKRPVRIDAGDTVTVTCHHEQDLRDHLPAFEGQQEKYVVWAEGTTDEMCLGMLQVVFE